MLDSEPEIREARLAFPDAQASMSGVVETRLGDVDVSWYGTAVQEDRGCFALVRPDNVANGLPDLVGDHLAITYEGRTVYVYVIGSSDDLTTPVAVTRRTFMALGLPPTTSLFCAVEVLERQPSKEPFKTSALGFDTSGLVGWWKAATLSGNDDDDVATWTDLSGYSRDLVQIDANYRPLLKKGANGINGRAVVRFDGDDDYMEHVGGSDWITGTQLTIFAVVRRISWVDGQAHCSGVANTGTDDYLSESAFISGLQNSSATALADFRENTALSSLTHPGNGTAFIDESVWNGTTNTRYVDGVAGTTVGSSGSFAVRRLLVGARLETTLKKFANHDLAELLILTDEATEQKRASIRSYLGIEYGVEVA